MGALLFFQPKIIQQSSVISTPNPAENISASNSSTSAPQVSDTRPRENAIYIEIDTPAKQYKFQIPSETNLYDAMNLLSKDTDFRFEAKSFSDLGYYIKSINGQPETFGRYWMYYVNGKSASVGVSSYILKANDVITWKLE